MVVDGIGSMYRMPRDAKDTMGLCRIYLISLIRFSSIGSYRL